jgi:hypothetical protein
MRKTLFAVAALATLVLPAAAEDASRPECMDAARRSAEDLHQSSGRDSVAANIYSNRSIAFTAMWQAMGCGTAFGATPTRGQQDLIERYKKKFPQKTPG